MKICYVCLTSPWDRMGGGGQIVIHSLATKMAEMGHTVYVIYTSSKVRPSAPKVNYNIIWTHHFEKGYLNIFSIFYALIKLLKRENLDILHPIEGEALLVLPFLRRQTIFVTTTHSPYIPDIKAPALLWHPISFINHINVHMRLYLTRLCMHLAKLVIAVSDYSAQNVASRFRIPFEKLKVIPNGVDKELLEYSNCRKDEAGPATILFVGRLDDQKGVDVLIRAMVYVTKLHPARLIIVGTGWKEVEFKQLAQSLSLQEVIDFVGRIPHSEVPSYIKKADIFVLPSRWDNCPLSILEAMALGTPIISTSIGGIPELLQNGYTGVLVPAEDPQALSGAIIDLLDNRDKRRYLAENAKRFVAENLTWDIVAQRYNELYKSLLNTSQEKL